MSEQTMSKLNEMKLNGMAEVYEKKVAKRNFRQMDFNERFSLLVDLEYSRRKSNKLQQLMKAASFLDFNAYIEDIEYHADRRLNKEQILKMASGAYLLDGHNIILKGLTGFGKMYLAKPFGVLACKQSFKVKYIRLPELLDELTLAKLAADDSYQRLIKKYTKVDLLI